VVFAAFDLTVHQAARSSTSHAWKLHSMKQEGWAISLMVADIGSGPQDGAAGGIRKTEKPGQLAD